MFKIRNFVLSAALAGLSITLPAQMVNPAIDAGNEPFSYYSHPTDEIGVMDAPSGTLISPEGFLYTGFGELMFFTGNPVVPISQRVKTLLRGYLPVVQYEFTRDGVRYEFECFAATLDGKPSGTQVNFIRVRIRNTVQESRTAWFSSGIRYQGTANSINGEASNRFSRPRTSSKPGYYVQPGETFNAHWAYSSGHDTIVRDGKILYYFPEKLQHTLQYMLDEDPEPSNVLKSKVLTSDPTSPVGIVSYRLALKPGEEVSLDWKMPVIPMAAGSALESQIRDANYDTYRSRTVDGWEQVLRKGMDIQTPEDKANDTFKASLIYDLIARNKIGDDYVQTVNDFHYHAFWLRDASFIASMYDLTGYPDYARQVLDFFGPHQNPDGNFLSQSGQYDGVGQVLWSYGRHYALTHDRGFADKVFPSVERAVAWIQQARQSDPQHLLPSATPGDDEAITGHITGHNIWGLDGIQNAILLARATGHTQQAAQFQKEYDNYHAAVMRAFERVASHTGGYITAGLDDQPGQDWDNLLTLYPEQVLPPSNPMVKATLDATRAKYKEGIMTYADGQVLHDYIGFSNTEDELVLGEQRLAVQDLYAELLHTSSTHAGFETSIVPWGDRDFHDNLTPHGWYAARLRITMRNMFVREQGNDLHLLSAISPAWIYPGSKIEVDRVPTSFGTVDLSLNVLSSTSAVLNLHDAFSDSPSHVVLHLPWFLETSKIVADGVSLQVKGDSVVLPAHTRTVQLEWHKQAAEPDLSYQAVVAQYVREYAVRYEQFLKTAN
jgi:hypothetical protein